MISSEFKEELIKYSELYVQLGILEKLLRVRIPAILTTKVGTFETNGWISMLNLDVKSQGKLRQARIHQQWTGEPSNNSIAEFLPLSFWGWVISGRHYTSLWIPYTHQISCDFEARKSFHYFKTFEKRMHSAIVDRNFVAHYNFSRILSIEDSLANVRWLQEEMGLVKAEWGVEPLTGLVIGINIQDWLFNALAAQVDQTFVADCLTDPLAMFLRVNTDHI